jgi:hypothetical protein
MSLYTELRHPGADIGQTQDPDPFSTGYTRFNGRVAAWVTARIGSMWTVYIWLAVTAIWMLLGSRQLLGFDPYPYPFLLFLGNVVQLLLIFVILLGQQVLGRSADRRAMRTYDYAEAIVVDCEQICSVPGPACSVPGPACSVPGPACSGLALACSEPAASAGRPLATWPGPAPGARPGPQGGPRHCRPRLVSRSASTRRWPRGLPARWAR